MSTFAKEVKIIPRGAWVTAYLFYAVFASLVFFVILPKERDTQDLVLPLRLAIALGVPLLIGMYVLMIGYIHADAKRRSMRYIMWTWLAALLPQAIGIFLYFIVRDPLPRPCPGCSVPLAKGFVFCPHCGMVVAPTCPSCGKAVERGWVNCAYCGVRLPEVASSSTPVRA